MSFEYVCVSITTPCGSVTVVAIYRPGSSTPDATFFSEFTTILETLATFNSQLVILGDLNVHLEDLEGGDCITMNGILESFASLLLPPAPVANSASIAYEGIAAHISSRLRYESGRSLQRSPVRILLIPPRQASVRVELGRSAGPEHLEVQQHISCHSRRAPLASNQEKDRLQDRPYGPTLHGRCCAGVSDGVVPSSQLSRRSTMSPVSFSW